MSPAKKSLSVRVGEAVVKAMESVLGNQTDGLDLAPLDMVDDIDMVMVKANDEKRYGLGPVYIPNAYDAHDEWATADDLEESCWDYVRKAGGDRKIYLQHSTKPAGESVGILTGPRKSRLSCTSRSTGVEKAVEQTFPAGTPFMGVIWDPGHGRT
jgi:hypothetical protein